MKIEVSAEDFEKMCKLECSRNGILVYIAMRLTAAEQKESGGEGVLPTYEHFAKVCNISVRSVSNAVAELVKLNILRVYGEGDITV